MVKTWWLNGNIIRKLKFEKSSAFNESSLNIWRFRKISIVSEWSKFCLGWACWATRFFFSELLAIWAVVNLFVFFRWIWNCLSYYSIFSIVCKLSVKFCKMNHQINRLCCSKIRHLQFIPLIFFKTTQHKYKFLTYVFITCTVKLQKPSSLVDEISQKLSVNAFPKCKII